MSVAALVLLGDLALRPVPAAGFAHQGSRIRFQEHSPAVFDQARREGKPIFLLFSAAWCYWCKTFEQDALRADEVTAHLNRHWLSVFVDHDLRPDLVSRYVRGLPMVVLFGPDGRVRQSFAGALRKEDFLSVLQRIEGEVRVAQVAPEPGPRPERPVVVPQPVSVTPSGYRSLLAGVARYVDEQADSVHGGFGVGTKAPNGRLLVFLLEQEVSSAGGRGGRRSSGRSTPSSEVSTILWRAGSSTTPRAATGATRATRSCFTSTPP